MTTRTRDAKGRFCRKAPPIQDDWRALYRAKVIKLDDAPWLIACSRHARSVVDHARSVEALEIATARSKSARARADQSAKELAERLVPFLVDAIMPEIEKRLSASKADAQS